MTSRITEVTINIERVFVNVTANMLVSGILENLFPDYSSSRNTWVQFFEGVTEIVMHVMIVPQLADDIVGFREFSTFDIVSALILGQQFLPNAQAKLRQFQRSVVRRAIPFNKPEPLHKNK